jgi:outer membrane PBP1 activator LpoA protein
VNRKILVLISLIVINLITNCAHKPNIPTFTTSNQPRKITLLVPLHGNLAGSGEAICDGFLAAYYYSLQHEGSDSSIEIIDTSQGDIKALYSNAVTNGADFIVGPLTKQNVQAIAGQKSLPVTTLALNTISNYNITNLFQFGLSSQDEALQVVKRAWAEHPGKALIIAPDNDWGQNMASTLQNTWQSFPGTITATLFYDDQTSLNKQIQHILNVDLSQNNATTLRKILWKEFKFIPRRRQDIDVILLIAPPKQARQIRPLLQFYFAGDLPIYSTSMVYSGIPQPHLDRDLDGIIFCDMPWVLRDVTTLPQILPILRDEITKLWPNSYKRYTRLYALGIDAYYLMLNLNKLMQYPYNGIAGATGIFYIDNYQHIYRQLDWAQIRDGIPYPL